MLVSYISLKSIAKILLILMMPGGKAPDNTSQPQPLYLQIPASHLMAQGPFVTQYNQGYLLQFQASADAYLISPEQMTQIINSMTIAERDAAFADPANISFNLAAHIVLLNNALRGLSESSAQAHPSSMHFSPSSHTPHEHSLHGHFENMRREHAPTFFQAVHDLGQKNNIRASISFIPASHQNRFANSVRPIKGTMLTEPPGTIEQYKQQGNIQMLRLKRDCKLAQYKSWWAHLADYYDIQFELEQAERSLIDLGHIEHSQLQKVRDMAIRGNMPELQARYQKVCALLKDTRCGKGIDRKRAGGTRMLRLEKYYLERAVNNELITQLELITKAEGPEIRGALAAVYKKYYQEMDQNKRTFYELPAGFNIIEAAHALVMQQCSNGAQIIAAVQQEFAHATDAIQNTSSSSSSSATSTAAHLSTANTIAPTPTVAPTTTTATVPGITTTTYEQPCTTSDLPANGTNTSSTHSIFVDSAVTRNDPEFDFVETYAYDTRVNISKDVDDRVKQALDAIQPQDFDNFDLYMDQVDKVMEELRQTGQLTPTQERNLLRRFVKRLFTSLNPVTMARELPSALLHATLLLADLTNIDAPGDTSDSIGWMFVNEDVRLARAVEILDTFDPSKLSKLSTEQWTDFATDVAADIFAGYLIGKGIPVIKGAIRNAKVLETIKSSTQPAQALAKKLAEKLRSIAKPSEGAIATTAEGISVEIGAATAVQETILAQEANESIRGATQKIENLLVSASEQAVIKNLADGFVATVQQDIPHLRQLFDGKFKGFGPFANKFLKFDYEHILGMELDFTRRGMPKIRGFHHDFMGVIEKSGVLEFTNKQIFSNGSYAVELKYLGHKVKDITFFPAHWTREKIIEKILEACENFVKSGAEISLESSEVCSIQALTNEGIKIQMYITKNGLINTAYPIIN